MRQQRPDVRPHDACSAPDRSRNKRVLRGTPAAHVPAALSAHPSSSAAPVVAAPFTRARLRITTALPRKNKLGRGDAGATDRCVVEVGGRGSDGQAQTRSSRGARHSAGADRQNAPRAGRPDVCLKASDADSSVVALCGSSRSCARAFRMRRGAGQRLAHSRRGAGPTSRRERTPGRHCSAFDASAACATDVRRAGQLEARGQRRANTRAG